MGRILRWGRHVLGQSGGPIWSHPTVGFILLVTVLSPLAGGAPADPVRVVTPSTPLPMADSGQLRIVKPTDTATVGGGNLLLLEAEAVDPAVTQVHFAVGGGENWMRAVRSPEQMQSYTYVWPDPPVGSQRIRARAYGSDGRALFEHGVTVQVADVWTGAILIDNPYAGAGAFRKGQMHIHSTNSFDGWLSMPPADLAREYKKRGYHFVVLTDHDVVSYPREVDDAGFIVIPGFESTSDAGHITGAFTEQAVAPSLRAQARIDGIRAAGGLAILNHPIWRIGFTGSEVQSLQGYTAVEIYNGKTSEAPERGLKLWSDALNVRGWSQRVWGMAVDDAHATNEIDRAWIVAKLPELTSAALRQSLESGSFFSSNGPSFSLIGVLNEAITAWSADARVIRFVDQDMRVLAEGPASGASYRPKGTERWVRVEAVAADRHAAWSQPFWLSPNAPKAELVPLPTGRALAGETVPGARVHVSDNGEYLGSSVANGQGSYMFRMPRFVDKPHNYWVMATAPWPDQLPSPPTLLNYPTTTIGSPDGSIEARVNPRSSVGIGAL